MVIAGAGIVGLTTALLLLDAGKDVAILEMDRIARGVSGYTTGKITATHGTIYRQLIEKHGRETAAGYASANSQAVDWISALVEEHEIPCDFERKTNYVYCEDASCVSDLEDEVEAARKAGLDVELVADTSLPYGVAAALKHPDQAQFHARKYLLHLAELVEARGGQIFEMTRATGINESDRCTVDTDRGTIAADHVVVATNYPFTDRGLMFARVHPKRSYAVTGAIDPSKAPDGMFISADSPTRSIRTIPDGERLLLMVGGNGHGAGQKTDTSTEYEDLENWMAERFGITEITHRWSSQDGVTVDLLPYVGTAWRSSDSVYTATGFRKWGLTNGTAAAHLIADSILGKDNASRSIFDPHRFTPVASAPKFATENAKAGYHFIADRLQPPEDVGFKDLAPGEAAVRRSGLEQIAGYRDESGALTKVSARCTHLGCIVNWNNAERSWDCPCHGSRFTPEGRVIQGPAVKDLDQR